VNKGPDSRIFIGLAVLIFLIGVFAVYSEYGTVSSAEDRVTKKRSEVQQAEAIRKDLAKSDAEVQDLQNKLAHLEKGVQVYQYIPKALKDLEQVGNANGIKVVGIRPFNKPPAPPKADEKEIRKTYDEQPVEIKGRGSYDDVMRFLKALQSFPQVLAVRSIALTPKIDPTQPQTAAKPNLDVTADLIIFVFPQPTSPTDGSPVATTGVSNNG
jgi:Tfp pilus assembly protein PilO